MIEGMNGLCVKMANEMAWYSLVEMRLVQVSKVQWQEGVIWFAWLFSVEVAWHTKRDYLGPYLECGWNWLCCCRKSWLWLVSAAFLEASQGVELCASIRHSQGISNHLHIYSHGYWAISLMRIRAMSQKALDHFTSLNAQEFGLASLA